MDLYQVVVFVHVLAAIVVVGGSLALDFAGARAKRAPTVESLMSWLQAAATGSKAVVIAAAITGLAGLYLGFDGDWWGSGWIEVALVLFIVAGAMAGAIMDKGTARMIEVTEGLPPGPMKPEYGSQLVQPAMALAAPIMIGIDVAIVFLMTNKPGFVGSLVVSAVTVGLGAIVGLRERQHALHPSAPAGPPAPAAGPA